MGGDWEDKLTQLVAELDNLIPLLRYVPQHILTERTPTEPSGLELLLGISRVDARALAELDPEADILAPPSADQIQEVFRHVRSTRLALVDSVAGIELDLSAPMVDLIEGAISHSTDVLRQIGYRVLESGRLGSASS